MNGFNFNGFNNENPLMQYLKQYAPPQSPPMDMPQPSAQPPAPEPPRGNGNGVLYEINCPADIDYIETDKSGRMQIFICQNEKRIYTCRYNHSRQKPDYREYIQEEETKLSQKNDANNEISQIAKALILVSEKLETMHGEIQGLKNLEIQKEESTRRPNGQFKKRGE